LFLELVLFPTLPPTGVVLPILRFLGWGKRIANFSRLGGGEKEGTRSGAYEGGRVWEERELLKWGGVNPTL